MTIKQLVTAENPILQKHVPDVSRFDENLAQLLLDLEDTMYEVCLLYTSPSPRD